jgi:hypothetical protein
VTALFGTVKRKSCSHRHNNDEILRYVLIRRERSRTGIPRGGVGARSFECFPCGARNRHVCRLRWRNAELIVDIPINARLDEIWRCEFLIEPDTHEALSEKHMFLNALGVPTVDRCRHDIVIDSQLLFEEGMFKSLLKKA